MGRENEDVAFRDRPEPSSTSPDPTLPRYAHFRGAKLVQVIRIEVNEGSGIPGEDDPIRRVVYYLTLEGKLLWHDDTLPRRCRGDNDA